MQLLVLGETLLEKCKNFFFFLSKFDFAGLGCGSGGESRGDNWVPLLLKWSHWWEKRLCNYCQVLVCSGVNPPEVPRLFFSPHLSY